MSLVITRSLFCDGQQGDCPAWYAENTDAPTEMIRAQARQHGWKCRKGKDLCPECVAAPEVPKHDDARTAPAWWLDGTQDLVRAVDEFRFVMQAQDALDKAGPRVVSDHE